MAKLVAIALLALSLGCGDDGVLPPALESDQCLRRELFVECLEAVPSGPDSTQYNDWSEVVSECANNAYYTSQRRPSVIPKGCR